MKNRIRTTLLAALCLTAVMGGESLQASVNNRVTTHSMPVYICQFVLYRTYYFLDKTNVLVAVLDVNAQTRSKSLTYQKRFKSLDLKKCWSKRVRYYHDYEIPVKWDVALLAKSARAVKGHEVTKYRTYYKEKTNGKVVAVIEREAVTGRLTFKGVTRYQDYDLRKCEIQDFMYFANKA